MSTGTATSRTSPGWTVFSVLGPPVFWALHLTIAYPLPDVACALGSRWPFHVLTALALAATLAAGVIGWRHRAGSFLADPRDEHAGIAGRDSFLGWCSVIASALFGGAILMAHVGVLVVDPCMH